MLVRLEMDQECMNLPALDTLPTWAVAVDLAAHFGTGFWLGFLYFRSLWWTTRRFSGRGSVLAILALMIGRFVLIGGALGLVSLEGGMPLLTMALGVMVARFAVVNGIRKTAP